MYEHTSQSISVCLYIRDSTSVSISGNTLRAPVSCRCPAGAFSVTAMIVPTIFKGT
jgi:hypothetical protein